MSQLITKLDLVDAWRVRHPQARQYTWVRVEDSRVSAVSLDRVYISQAFSNRLLNSVIHPFGFTDHHLITVDLYLSPRTKSSAHWHFNVKLLHVYIYGRTEKRNLNP